MSEISIEENGKESILTKKREAGELLFQAGKEKEIAAIIVGLSERERLLWVALKAPVSDKEEERVRDVLVEELITPEVRGQAALLVGLEVKKLKIEHLYRQYAKLGGRK